jgi:hypothetical protein
MIPYGKIYNIFLSIENPKWPPVRHSFNMFGDSENRENNYLKIRDLLSIALFNILGTHYVIHI